MKNYEFIELYKLRIGAMFSFDEPSINNPEYNNQLIKLYNGGRFKYRRLIEEKNGYSDVQGQKGWKLVYTPIHD